MLNLKERYNKKALPKMREEYGYTNDFSIPRLEKIVVNSGIGKMINSRKGSEAADSDEALIQDIILEFMLITGQKPAIIRAKKSISGFKLRKGMISGVKATLRGGRMYDFLDRIINIALPRTRDFRGIDIKTVDKSGNMSIGIKEQIIFPEIPHDKVRQMWGMEVTLVTTASNKEEGIALFKGLGMPFKDQEK